MNNRIGNCITYLTNSDTIKICWYWPDTDTDTRISAALIVGPALFKLWLFVWRYALQSHFSGVGGLKHMHVTNINTHVNIAVYIMLVTSTLVLHACMSYMHFLLQSLTVMYNTLFLVSVTSGIQFTDFLRTKSTRGGWIV